MTTEYVGREIVMLVDAGTPMVCGILATSSFLLKVYPPALPIKITMPCGEVAEFEAPQDFPLQSQRCSCGNEKHGFIKYEEAL